MKKYTVTTASFENFTIVAKDLKEAEKIARRQCRRDGEKFFSVKLTGL